LLPRRHRLVVLVSLLTWCKQWVAIPTFERVLSLGCFAVPEVELLAGEALHRLLNLLEPLLFGETLGLLTCVEGQVCSLLGHAIDDRFNLIQHDRLAESNRHRRHSKFIKLSSSI